MLLAAINELAKEKSQKLTGVAVQARTYLINQFANLWSLFAWTVTIILIFVAYDIFTVSLSCQKVPFYSFEDHAQYISARNAS